VLPALVARLDERGVADGSALMAVCALRELATGSGGCTRRAALAQRGRRRERIMRSAGPALQALASSASDARLAAVAADLLDRFKCNIYL